MTQTLEGRYLSARNIRFCAEQPFLEQVIATVIQPGVVRVIVPPHEAGQVEVMLTLGDGVPLSNPVPFSYRPNPEALSER